MTGWLRANGARLVSGLAIAAVAGVAGTVSYTHIYELTLALHGSRMTARLMPVTVDGLLTVGSVVLLQAPKSQPRLGWLGVGPGVAISLFANVESGIRWGWLSALWAGVPAASFALATFLLERWLRSQVQAEAVSQTARQEPGPAERPRERPAARPRKRTQSGGVRRSLPDTQAAYLAAMTARPDATVADLAADLGVSPRTVRRVRASLNGHAREVTA